MPVASARKTKRKPRSSSGLFPSSPAPALATFGTGEVAEVLEIPIWRLQKFLDSPQYQLSAEGKLGEGLGSRRVFKREDIYRIAIAKHLVQDGLVAKFVGALLEQIEDDDFYESRDHAGSEIAPPGWLGLIRGTSRPIMKLFYSKQPPKLGEKDSPYYLLNLDEVKGEVDKRIARTKK
jgi:hypothetical protein